MADTKRRGWLSFLRGGDKPTAAPEQSLAPPPNPGRQALDLLFGQPGQAPAEEPASPPSAPPSDKLPGPPAVEPLPPAAPPPAPAAPAKVAGADAQGVAADVQLRIRAHVSNRGDMQAGLDAWVGERGCGEHVEGLSLTALDGIDPDDLEYLALLDDGGMTDWHRNEAYCGTRGEARPLHGYALRLIGPAAWGFRISYAAVFADGAEVGPMADSQLCAAPSRAALEAIYVMIDPVVR